MVLELPIFPSFFFFVSHPKNYFCDIISLTYSIIWRWFTVFFYFLVSQRIHNCRHVLIWGCNRFKNFFIPCDRPKIIRVKKMVVEFIDPYDRVGLPSNVSYWIWWRLRSSFWICVTSIFTFTSATHIEWYANTQNYNKPSKLKHILQYK